MKKKIERKNIGKIAKLVGVGILIVILLLTSVSAVDPNDWSFGGNPFAGGTTAGMGTTTNDDLIIITGPGGGTQRIIIDGIGGTGNVGIGYAAGTAPNPVIRLDVQGQGVTPATAGLNVMDGAGASILYVRDDGFVGICNPAPTSTLDVAGTVTMNGFSMPNGAVAGYVLTTDAAGTGTWQVAPGGIGGSGTINRIPKFTAASTLGNSVIYDISGNIGIGTPTPGGYKLYVAGTLYATQISTGPGLTEIYMMNQDIQTTDPVDFANINTGWGYNELYEMNQNVKTTNDVTFDIVRMSDYGYALGGFHVGGNSDPGTDDLVVDDQTAISTSIQAGTKLHVGGTSLYGGYFENNYNSDGGVVLYAEYTGSQDGTAVKGIADQTDDKGTGGHFEAGSVGVYAYVNPSGSSSYYGVQSTVSGGSGTNYGIWADASGGGTNYAGWFNDDTHINGALSKSSGSFKIDHPLDPANKYLYHSFVESPDMKNIYDGVVILDKHGEAKVELPEWFDALNKDFRYQLTSIDAFAPVFIAEEISNNQFTIAGGEPDMKVSWQVTGIRQDIYAETYPIPVEEIKPDQDRGKYLHPELYGMPENMAIGYLEQTQA